MFQGELGEPVLLAEELLGEVGKHRVLPDDLDPFLVQVGVHEVARTDGGVPLVQLLVGPIHHLGHPRHLGLVLAEPSGQQTLHWRLVGEEGREVETPPQSRIDQSDRPIGGVHRPDDPKVLGQREGLVRILQVDEVFSVLQEEVKLTEHLGHVPPVDLVDDKNERFPGRFLSPPGDPLERTIAKPEASRAASS